MISISIYKRVYRINAFTIYKFIAGEKNYTVELNETRSYLVVPESVRN